MSRRAAVLYLFTLLVVSVTEAATFDDYDFSLTPTSKVPSKKEELMNAECITGRGKKGVCVKHYQCDKATGAVNTGGEDIFDVRTISCPNQLDVCCEDIDEVKSRFGESDSAENTNVCGQSKSFGSTPVKNGTAKFGEFPWVVALLNRTETGNWSEYYFGVGVIIHPSVVATIAHKFEQSLRRIDTYTADETKVRAGEYDALTTTEPHTHQDRNVKKIIKHNEFIPSVVRNDIALLVLETPFDMSAPHIGVACLASAPLPASAGANCVGAGWGTTDFESQIYSTTLKKVTLPIVDPEDCQSRFRATARYGKFYQINPSLMCAGGMRGEDLCRGDGGAPLSCPVGGANSQRYVVYGLSVHGLECSGKNPVPSQYANIPHLYSWIDRTMTAEGFDVGFYRYTL